MKKIVLIILTLLLIPFFIITIATIDREEVNPTLDLTLTETHNSIIDLNNHTLKEVFEDDNKIKNGTFETTDNWVVTNGVINDGRAYMSVLTGGSSTSLSQGDVFTVSNDYYIVINDVDIIQGGFWLTNLYLNTSFTLSDGFNSAIKKAVGTVFQIARLNTTENHEGYFDNIFVIDLSVLDISTLTKEQMDYWYNVYITYGSTYEYIQFGTATAGDYLALQQLIIDNDSEEFKLYRDDIIDEVHYVMTQNVDNIVVSDVDGNELFILYSDDTYISRVSLSDTTSLSFVGYNITGYIDGSFDNTILAFLWIIPILLIGGFFFVIFSHRKEE